MRVLIVDDQATMRRIIMQMLKKLGHEECYEAQNGADAVERLETLTVDVVISDCRMPTMDGIDLIHALRANESTKRLPVLIVTANADEANVLTALRAGATNYLVKPFTLDSLRDKMSTMH
jgi:two-component system, chemotaxis family, chemotaxis protein CheY